MACVGGLAGKGFGTFVISGLLAQLRQHGEGIGAACVGGLAGECFSTYVISGPFLHLRQHGEAIGAACVGGLSGEGFYTLADEGCCAFVVSGLLHHLRPAAQGREVACGGGLAVEGFGSFVIYASPLQPRYAKRGVGVGGVGDLSGEGFYDFEVFGPFPHLHQTAQGRGVARFDGSGCEVVGPLEAVSVSGFVGEVVEVVGVGEVGVGGGPKRARWAQHPAGVAAVLFEVVGESQHCPCCRGAGGGGWWAAGWAALGACVGAAQGGLFAVDGAGEFGEGGFCPLGGPRPRAELERTVPEVPGQRRGWFVVELDGAMVGTVQLKPHAPESPGNRRPEAGETELGYLFLPEAWGRGYATEACAAALDWFAGVLPGEPVALYTQTANASSMRLAAKLGFTELERFEAWGAEQWFGVWSSGTPSG